MTDGPITPWQRTQDAAVVFFQLDSFSLDLVYSPAQTLSRASHLGALRGQGTHGAVITVYSVPHSLCEEKPWDFLRGGNQRSFPFYWEDNSHFIVKVKKTFLGRAGLWVFKVTYLWRLRKTSFFASSLVGALRTVKRDWKGGVCGFLSHGVGVRKTWSLTTGSPEVTAGKYRRVKPYG